MIFISSSWVHLFCNWMFVPPNLSSHILLIPASFHLATTCVFSVSETDSVLFCLFIWFVFYILHISESIHYFSVFVWLISLNIIPSRSIHIISKGKISFFSWLSNIAYITHIYVHLMHLFFYHWTVMLLLYLGYCKKKKCCNVMAEVILHSL